MSLEDFLVQQADITAEAAPEQVPAQDSLGGAVRTDPWLSVVSGVPCLVRPMSSTLAAFGSARDDARRGVNMTRIYFATDPAPEGLSSRHRITVDNQVYAVQGVQNPNTMDRIFQVDCETIRD